MILWIRANLEMMSQLRKIKKKMKNGIFSIFFPSHRGVVRRRWRPLTSDVPCNVELALEANHVFINNEQKSGVTITDEIVSTLYIAIASQTII